MKTPAQPLPVIPTNPKPKHLLITVHGIRTFGKWQQHLGEMIKEESGGTIVVRDFHYGRFGFDSYFSLLGRKKPVDRFRAQLLTAVNEDQWSRIDIAAHSFGTYVVAKGLLAMAESDCNMIHTVIFSGSMLSSEFEIDNLVGKRMRRFVNECGTRDWILWISYFLPFGGMAGRVGFKGHAEGDHFRNRYFALKHDGYFESSDAQPFGFVRTYWFPLLRSGHGIQAVDERVKGRLDDFTEFASNNGTLVRLGVLALIAITLWPMFSALSHYLGVLRKAKATAESRRLATQSSNLRADNIDLEPAALLAIEALQQGVPVDSDTDSAIREVSRLLARQIGPTRTIDGVQTIAFSKDGKYVAAWNALRISQIIDVKSGATVSQLADQGIVTRFAFSPDSQWIAVLETDDTLRVFNVKTGQLTYSKTFPADAAAVSYSGDGKYLAVGLGDKAALILDAQSFTEVASLPVTGWIVSFAFSDDGKHLATGCHDHAIRVFDITTHKEEWHTFEEAGVQTLGFSPDSQGLAVAEDLGVRGFEAKTGRPSWRFDEKGIVSTVNFSPDGQYLATGSADRTARVFDLTSRQEISRIVLGAGVVAVQFDPDTNLLTTVSLKDDWRSFEWKDRREIARFVIDGAGPTIAFSSDRRWLATVANDRTARRFDIQDGKEIWRIPIPPTYTMRLSPDDEQMVTAGLDSRARMFEVTSGKQTHELIHQGMVVSVTFSADSRFFATGSADGAVRVFEAKAASLIKTYNLGGTVFAVSISPDDKYVAAGNDRGDIQVFAMDSGVDIARIKVGGLVRGLAIAPDGQAVAAASEEDQTISVFALMTGKVDYRIAGLKSVFGLIFSADGQYLIAATAEGGVRMFRASDGVETSDITAVGSVRAISLQASTSLMTAGVLDENGKTVIVVEEHLLRPDDLVRDACERLTRNLSQSEWTQYVGSDTPYRKTCKNLP